MQTVRLECAKAARWVWESLWSPRRHVRMDILDVALLEYPPDATTPTITQWLFTAKDGRTMKKSSTTASLAVLKQTLLGKALRGATSDSDSRSSRGNKIIVSSGGAPFATALLSSGRSLPVDEHAWGMLVRGRRPPGVNGDDVVAVMALDPGDYPEFCRGPRQHLLCEYRTKTDRASPDLDGPEPATAPVQVVTTTFIRVASELLRGGENIADESKENEQAHGRKLGSSKTSRDGFLVSRAKATNREVETKLRRIVQWVQETRRVRVLDMTAMFTVLPSSGTGSPGAWLERVISARVVQNEIGSSSRAPCANVGVPALPQQTLGFPDIRSGQHSVHPQMIHQTQSEPALAKPPDDCTLREGDATDVNQSVEGLPPTASIPAHDASSRQEEEKSSSSSSSSSSGWSKPENGSQHQQHDVIPAAVDDSVGSRPRIAAQNSCGNRQASMSDILAEATTAVLAVGPGDGEIATDLSDPPRGNGKPDAGSLAVIAASWRRRGNASVATVPEASPGTAKMKTCAGDFCMCAAELSTALQPLPDDPRSVQLVEEVVENEDSKLDWTGIGIAHEGHGLLEVDQRRSTSVKPAERRSSGEDLPASITFKSICMARFEAEKGQDFYWGEYLRQCWKKGGHRENAGEIGLLNPAIVYKEALVCRACYDVYRRLDQLRGQVDRLSGRDDGCSNNDVSARTDVSPTSHQHKRGAAAEAGAARLSSDLTAMLRGVDERSGKLGIEAGIFWRRRLSKRKSSKGAEFSTEINQARLVDRLARPKQTSREESGVATSSRRSSGSKRRVKSQGDVPVPVGRAKPYRRRVSAPRAFSCPLRREATLTRNPSWRGAHMPQRSREEEEIECQTRVLPRGKPRRNPWPLQNYHDNRKSEGPREAQLATSHLTTSLGDLLSTGEQREERSGETIRAIEALLEEGGESYLPVYAHDLPEAAAILGPKLMSPQSTGDKDSRLPKRRHQKDRRRSGRRGSIGTSRTDADDAESRAGDQVGAVFDPADCEATERHDRRRKSSSTSVRQDRVLERFLHPWQRKLEAEKREKSGQRLEEGETVLVNEKRRRSEERRASASSEECRRAARRVAAHLGRFHVRQRARDRHGAKSVTREQIGESEPSNGQAVHENGPENQKEGLTTIKTHGEQPGSNVVHVAHCLEQMRDSLGWARKTMVAITKRLERKGVDVRSIGSTRKSSTKAEVETDALIEEMRRHVAAFEDDVSAVGSHFVGTAAEGISVNAVSQRCDEACEEFESQFHRLIEGLTTKVSSMGHTDSGEACPDERHDVKIPFHDPAHTPHLQFCPACTIVPVARRCLDCQSDYSDRDRCSGCFVREHRSVSRRDHRFLRIGTGNGAVVGGRGGSGVTDSSALGDVPRIADDREKHRTNVNSSFDCIDGDGGDVGSSLGRCSKCGDLAASRKCQSCGDVDMCAACHFLAHRPPSRQSQETDLLNEDAVSAQEDLHRRQREAATDRDRNGSRNDVPAPDHNGSQSCRRSSPAIRQSAARNAGSASQAGASRNTQTNIDVKHRGRGEECRYGDVAQDGGQGLELFGEDAARSLAQVRRTLPPPVLSPLPPGTPPVITKESAVLTAEQEGLRDANVVDHATVWASFEHVGDHDLQSQAEINGQIDELCDAVQVSVGMSDKNNNLIRSCGGASLGDSISREGGGQPEGYQEGAGKERERVHDDGTSSSEEEEGDTDEEGMMWSPLNIATVDLGISCDEGKKKKASARSSPVPSPTKRGQSKADDAQGSDGYAVQAQLPIKRDSNGEDACVLPPRLDQRVAKMSRSPKC